MDFEGASISRNAHALSKWAAEQVVVLDEMLVDLERAPLTREQQHALVKIHRETLVKFSQQSTLLEWANDGRAGRTVEPVARWPRWLWRLVGRR